MQFPKMEREDKGHVEKQIKAYKQDNPMCAVCLYKGENSFTDHIHHIVNSITNMKIEDICNYLPVCFRCHTYLHELIRHKMIELGMRIKLWLEIKKAKGEI